MRSIWTITGIPQYANLRSYAYGLEAADTANNISINFVYNVPDATQPDQRSFRYGHLDARAQSNEGFSAIYLLRNMRTT
jgi:hypothetical protein